VPFAVNWISETIGISTEVQIQMLASVLTIIGGLILRASVVRVVRTRVSDPQVIFQTRRISTYVVSVLGILILAWIWIDAFDDLPTFLGLVSAGIAIALSDVLRNVAGWVYILSRRPFRIGDRIEIQGAKGDVVDIRLFRFSMMEIGNWVDAEQSTGRLVHVPNGLVFTNQVANHTEGFPYVWHEVPVLVTFESDWRRAEAIMLDVLGREAPDYERAAGAQIRAVAEQYHIKVGALTPAVYLSVRDSGVLLTVRLLVEARQRRGVEERIWRAVLDGFAAESNVELAYPTVRTYFDGPVQIRRDAPE
jgi:small-conductance mechanosensitive channel